MNEDTLHFFGILQPPMELKVRTLLGGLMNPAGARIDGVLWPKTEPKPPILGLGNPLQGALQKPTPTAEGLGFRV